MGSYPEFSSVNVGWSSYADRNLIIPLDVLFNCVSPCLMFLRFTVRCAAYAAWTTLGLAQTDKTCVKLTCLYQVRVSSGNRNTSEIQPTWLALSINSCDISGMGCAQCTHNIGRETGTTDVAGIP